MKKLILFGVGQMSEIAYSYFSTDSKYTVVGFCVDKSHYKDDKYKNLPVVSFEEVENFFPINTHCMFIPLAAKDSNRLREKKYLEAKSKGYELVSYISSLATILPESNIGENCFIGTGAVINAGTILGKQCIVGANAVVSGMYPDYCVIVGAPGKIVKRYDVKIKEWKKTNIKALDKE